MFWNFTFFTSQHKGYTREPEESNHLFLIFFFFTWETPESSDITTDGQYQIAPQDRWKQEKSDG